MKEGRAAASRAALLELRQEREVVQEGHQFLDEKCVLLAREILRRLDEYQTARSALRETEHAARRALGRALAGHGLEALQVHEPPALDESRVKVDSDFFLGLQLPRAALTLGFSGAARFESDAVEACARAFARLASEAAELAGRESALLRLAADYRHTERRVHALENLILPELHEEEREMSETLEEIDMEEAIRGRLFAGDKGLLR